ncbi:MAG: type I glutamate--ammonia ligase [Phototrophicales bacterium]|nr:MAG: type I glutamate--ammonia ligase [Phototrophicales bacterium]
MTTKQAILSAIKDQHIRFIDLWFTDVFGVVKSVTMPISEVADVIDRGTHFDGSSLDGFARVAESDMLLLPDLNTFAVLPWTDGDEKTARFICSVYTPQGSPFIGDPRYILARALQYAKDMGYSFKIGVEMEFFLFKSGANGRPDLSAPFDDASYFDLPTEKASHVRRKMISTLNALGICVNVAHSEIGRGQHEIEFNYDDALVTADNLLTARVALRTVAMQMGLHCTFMPRPIANQPGSGLHTHQSLHDAKTGDNVFADVDHEYGLSTLARHFLAGQLAHSRAMTAVLSPLVNSYKRLGYSFEAPVYVSWAHTNRAALIRVPVITKGKEAHTRLELRSPDPSTNPYLAATVMLMSGLDGLQNHLELPDPLEETLVEQKRNRLRTLQRLPATLGEALEALRADDVMMDALGEYIADRFLQAKQQEFDAYNQTISQWELDNYLERY